MLLDLHIFRVYQVQWQPVGFLFLFIVSRYLQLHIAFAKMLSCSFDSLSTRRDFGPHWPRLKILSNKLIWREDEYNQWGWNSNILLRSAGLFAKHFVTMFWKVLHKWKFFFLLLLLLSFLCALIQFSWFINRLYDFTSDFIHPSRQQLRLPLHSADLWIFPFLPGSWTPGSPSWHKVHACNRKHKTRWIICQS